MAVCTYGLIVARQLPVDVLPNLNRPTVTVITESHGLAPEEVESLVTIPIESILNGMPGVVRVRTSSGIGISIAYVEFDWNTEIFKNRQLIAERLQLLQGRLPAGVTPTMGPVTSIMGEIQFVGLSTKADDVTPMDLRTIADWTLRPQLMTIPGVSQVVVMGGQVKQYQILVSSAALLRRGITLASLERALQSMSENTTGGFLDIGDKEYLIRPLGRVSSLDDITNSVVGRHLGQPVFLRDVAKVAISSKTKRGEASINGKHGVILTIQKQPHASTIDLTRLIDEKLASIEPLLPPNVHLEKNLFRQAHFIETAISNVKEALRDGIVIVVIILLIFFPSISGQIQRHLKVSLEDYVPLRSSLSKKVRAGLQTSTELLSLEVFSDDIQRELRRLEGEKHELEDELLLILGFEHGSQVQLSPFPRYLQLAEPMPQEARHPDPEIRRLEMQAATARREAGIIHDWWVPELDLFAAYTGYNIAKSDAMLSLPRQQIMVGLRVSLDLESKSILRGEIASKLSNAMALDHQKEGIRAALDHKIQRFRHESNTNQTLLQSYEKGIKKGEALLKRLRGEFEQGIVSSGELAAGVHSFHLLKRRHIETTIQICLTQAGIETFFPDSSTLNQTTM